MKNFYRSVFVFVALAGLAAQSASAADYTIDPTHSSVNFKIHHMVSNVNGTFKDFSGEYSFDQKTPEKASVTFTIKTASINTDNEKRDKHLKSPDFFDVTKYPTITFKSKKVTADGKDKYKIVGDVTMHGVTHEETFAADFGGMVKDPWGNNRAGFSATSKFSRKNYGIIWNKTLDNGGFMLGDDVEVNLQLEATQKK